MPKPIGARDGKLALLIALLFIATNLRPAISSIAPLIETVRSALSLSYASASLLTSIPLVCMGVFPFIAAPLTDRIGMARGLLWAMLLIAAATAWRLAGGSASVLFATALLVGIGIAVAQTIVPGLVKQHFSARSASVMSLYSMCMTLGAGLSAAVSAPLQAALGGWPQALAFWAVPALLAAGAWAPFARDAAGTPGSPTARTRAGGLWRSRMAWLITGFSAGAFGLFWSAQTWLAALYQDQGWTVANAGLMIAGMMATQVATQLALATIADRWRDRRPLIFIGLGAAAIGFCAVAMVPLAAPWLWALLLGVGIGSVFPLALNLPIDHAADPVAASRMTAMALGGGYLVAALMPVAVGWLRGVAGGYVVPFMGLALVSGAMAITTLRFRPGVTDRDFGRPENRH